MILALVQWMPREEAAAALRNRAMQLKSDWLGTKPICGKT